MTTISIRNVPQDVRDELATRAARRGQSLQEHLRLELIRLASQPSMEDVLDRIRKRIEATGTRVTGETIVELLREDRGR